MALSIPPSTICGITCAPDPYPLLSTTAMLVSLSYPLPFTITSTENILLLLPTTNNKSAPDPLPNILISGGIQFSALVKVVLISS